MTDQAIEGQTALFGNAQLESLARSLGDCRLCPKTVVSGSQNPRSEACVPREIGITQQSPRAVRPVPEAKDPLVGLREFHGWTLNRLEVFENYLKMYRQVEGGGTHVKRMADLEEQSAKGLIPR